MGGGGWTKSSGEIGSKAVRGEVGSKAGGKLNQKQCVCGGGGLDQKQGGGEWDQKQGANVGVKDTFEGGGGGPCAPHFSTPLGR